MTDATEPAGSADDAAVYPHERDDCADCQAYDADMVARVDGAADREVRWCHRCAGQVLAHLVLTGHTVTVYAMGTDPDHEPAPVWTVDLAEQALRYAQRSGSVFLRALINEGGTATAARLKELTGQQSLQHMTLTVNAAVKKLPGGRRLLGEHRHLARPGRHPEHPRDAAVYDYTLPAELVPIFDEALRRLDR